MRGNFKKNHDNVIPSIFLLVVNSLGDNLHARLDNFEFELVIFVVYM